MSNFSVKTACAFALSLALILTFIKSGDFLSCYECNSHTNVNCSQSKPPNSTIVDCNRKSDGNKYTMCRKIHQTIDFEVNGLQPNTRIIRSCAWDDSQYKDACYQRSGFGGRQDVCSCSTDLCNSAPLNWNYPLAIIVSVDLVLMLSGRLFS